MTSRWPRRSFESTLSPLASASDSDARPNCSATRAMDSPDLFTVTVFGCGWLLDDLRCAKSGSPAKTTSKSIARTTLFEFTDIRQGSLLKAVFTKRPIVPAVARDILQNHEWHRNNSPTQYQSTLTITEVDVLRRYKRL